VTASLTIQALAEPHRMAILDVLREGESPVGQLASRLGQSQPGVSKHLRVLRDAGLVAVRADGQRRFYRVKPEPLVELDAWIATYRDLWTDRLDRLHGALEREKEHT
jgi:DNA-binding transcriptional ArsR family regulator